MIEVELYSDENGLLTGFRTKGHAGAGGYGHDIVCSAVSALTIGCVNSVETLTEAGYNLDAAEDGGFLELFLKRDSVSDHDAQLLLNALSLSVTQIAESYPENLRIRHIERKNYGR
jgi:uncharacterized protein YsxB (DUF464 family)